MLKSRSLLFYACIFLAMACYLTQVLLYGGAEGANAARVGGAVLIAVVGLFLVGAAMWTLRFERHRNARILYVPLLTMLFFGILLRDTLNVPPLARFITLSVGYLLLAVLITKNRKGNQDKGSE